MTDLPPLGPLFARAIATATATRDASEPAAPTERAASAVGVVIDADRLRRYQQVCQLRVSDVLPPTYLHALAFPLALQRMLMPDFPFAVIGLVHLGNRITHYRQVRPRERVGIDVRAANLREHRAGQVIDLVTDVRVGDELVWRETSSYLRRRAEGAARPSGTRPSGAPSAADPLARAALARWRAPRGIGRRYAAVAGDANPIHLAALLARGFGFKRAIAHGMWLHARTLAAFEGRLPDALSLDVAFKAPVSLPATVELRSAFQPGGGWLLDVRDPRSGRPHLTGRFDPL